MWLKSLTASISIALMLIILPGSATAAPVTFNIDAIFGGGDSGLTATGTFDYDPVTNEFSNINLTTPDGTISGGTYIGAFASASDTLLDFTTTTNADLTGSNRFSWTLSGSLNDLINGLTSSLGLLIASEGVCADATCSNFPGRGFSGMSSVTLAEVPLPGAALLFLTGFAGLLARRKLSAHA